MPSQASKVNWQDDSALVILDQSPKSSRELEDNSQKLYRCYKYIVLMILLLEIISATHNYISKMSAKSDIEYISSSCEFSFVENIVNVMRKDLWFTHILF